MAQQLSFASDIRPLFRDRDIHSMKFRLRPGFVRGRAAHAEAIYATLASSQMPCDGAWADDEVRRFRSWLDSGALP